MAANFLTVSALATAAGMSANVLRVWSDRYGWPQAQRRSKHGTRLFHATIVPLLRRVVELRDSGVAVGDIIGTGIPVFPAVAGVPRQTRPDLAGLVEPSDAAGKGVFRLVSAAADRGESEAAVRMLAEALLPRVRPADRQPILAIIPRVAAFHAQREGACPIP